MTRLEWLSKIGKWEILRKLLTSWSWLFWIWTRVFSQKTFVLNISATKSQSSITCIWKVITNIVNICGDQVIFVESPRKGSGEITQVCSCGANAAAENLKFRRMRRRGPTKISGSTSQSATEKLSSTLSKIVCGTKMVSTSKENWLRKSWTISERQMSSS